MILKKLANSIRQQDWVAVFIEFCIVVAGIFAGLQASDWARERQDRKQERAALERLFLESENSYRDAGHFLQRLQQLNGMRRNAVRFVDSDTPVPDNELPLKININTLAQFPTFSPVSVTCEELKSIGQLQLIQSAGLCEQIAGFHNAVAGMEQLRSDLKDTSATFWIAYQRPMAERGRGAAGRSGEEAGVDANAAFQSRESSRAARASS